MLDIDLLRTFAAVADTRSFTAAGQRVGATQSAVSVRLKKLEDRIGKPLLERTPRAVELTGFGEIFLGDARRILALHDDAWRKATMVEPEATLSLGVSEHAGGLALAAVLKEMREAMPRLRLKVTLGLSDVLLAELDRSRLDVAVIRRRLGAPGGGRVLFRDDLAWFAAPDLGWRPGETLPLVGVEAPCSTRQCATAALDGAGIAWAEVFLSRGVPAVQAACAAGLGVACLGRRFRPSGTAPLGAADGLPPLPASEVAMVDRVRDPRLRPVLERMADAFATAADDPVSG